MPTDLLDTMRTLNSVRAFRRDPVPHDILRQVIEAATWAPSARNAQPWFFVAVEDTDSKRAIATLYQRAWRQAQAFTAASGADRDIESKPDYAGMMRAVDQLATHLAAVPVLVFVCLDTAQLGRMADAAGNILSPQSAYASIFPAVQNLLLAARSHGLGTTLTTLHSVFEPDIRALLAIPVAVHVAALVPLGYPQRPFRAVKRKAVEQVAFLNRWGIPLR